MSNVQEWANKWGVPQEALSELFDHESPWEPTYTGMTEASVQQRVRLAASKAGMRLWRNNVGGFIDDYGHFVRYGLANESTAMNKKIKSSDLIGITPHVVGAGDVGKTLGIFTAVEVKEGSWKFKGNPHETAQQNFINLVRAMGGYGAFANSEQAIERLGK